MKKNKLATFSILFFVWLLLSPKLIHSQLVIGQYEDEAPIQTWNTYGIQTASSLGRGGSGFTLAIDSSSALLNPALLTQLPRLTFCFSGSYNAASLHRFSIFNTGVFVSNQNQTLGVYAGEYVGFSGKIGSWALALSVSIPEIYLRPETIWNYTFEGQVYYSLKFEQKGILYNTNLSLAKRISDNLSIGLGLNYVRGNHEKQIIEKWILSDMTISDSKTLQMHGFYLNGGIVWRIPAKITLAAIFRTPYRRIADGESLYRFEYPRASTDIQISGKGKSIFHHPMVIGMGMNFNLFRDIRLAADVSYFNWSQYEVEFFGEKLPRDFKNIIKANAGIELWSRHSIFQLNVETPLRLGFVYDPQPMKNPNSFYYGLTLGAGIRFRNVIADFAYYLGRESGSGHDLATKKILFSISIHVGSALR